MADPYALPSDLLTSASTGIHQSIESFLDKPYPISSGSFATTDTSGTFSIFQAFSSFLSNSIYANKVAGHVGIRGTLVLRVQFNPDRFMQGRYILAFMPMVAACYQNSSVRSMQMRFNKTTVTQLPRVEFDLATDTEAILEIPYVSPYSHFSIKDGAGDVGSWFIYPYVPLSTGSTGSTSCNYIVWASLKDVELVAPTLPQANIGTIGGKRPKATIRKKKNVTEMEQEISGIGPISSVMTRVARAADVLNRIPVLSSIAGPVSWASNILSDAASSFGWSKPLHLGTPVRMNQPYCYFWNNPDSSDTALPLSLMADNAVEPLPGFAGNNQDETSIDYLKSIPAFQQLIAWSTSMSPGALLMNQILCPARLSSAVTGTHTSFYTLLPVAYVAAMFKNYRGSIKMTFKIVKTEFHSGRLMISFCPSQVNSASWSLASSGYLHREILDIRHSNEFSYIFPYASLQTYRDINDNYGTMQLHIVNELVCPASVSSTVTILVEVSAAPDMEFAIPSGLQLTPIYPSTIQADISDIEGKKPQKIIPGGIIAGSSIFDDNIASARMCVGEKIRSLMSFLKKTTQRTVVYTLATSSQYTVLPYSISMWEDVGSAPYGDCFAADHYSAIMSCFALSRGGIRYRMTCPADPSNVIVSVIAATSTFTSTVSAWGGNPTVWDSNNVNLALSNNATFNLITAPCEVQIPSYGRFSTRVNQELIISPVAPYTPATPTVPQMTLVLYTAASFAPTFYRSVADDFQAGYFTGVPPMIIGNALSYS